MAPYRRSKFGRQIHLRAGDTDQQHIGIRQMQQVGGRHQARSFLPRRSRPRQQPEPPCDATGHAVAGIGPIAVGLPQFLQYHDLPSGQSGRGQALAVARQRRIDLAPYRAAARFASGEDGERVEHRERVVELVDGEPVRVELDQRRRSNTIEDVEQWRVAEGDAEDQVRFLPRDRLQVRLLTRADIDGTLEARHVIADPHRVELRIHHADRREVERSHHFGQHEFEHHHAPGRRRQRRALHADHARRGLLRHSRQRGKCCHRRQRGQAGSPFHSHSFLKRICPASSASDMVNSSGQAEHSISSPGSRSRRQQTRRARNGASSPGRAVST